MNKSFPREYHRLELFLLVAPILFMLSGLPASGGQNDQTAHQQRTEKYIEQMQQTYAGVKDYTCIFKKQERVDGKLLPQETITLKFKKPFAVYMKWITEPHEGQEVIYIQDWNDGKMRAHPGSFPDITLNLNPEGRLAMRGNRHPVTTAGLEQTIDILTHDFQRAMTHPEEGVRYVDRGIKNIAGERSQCFEAIVPVEHQADYYGHRALLCINLDTHLPNEVKIWDASDRLIEFYQYLQMKTNVGLKAEDFDPDNPEYDF